MEENYAFFFLGPVCHRQLPPRRPFVGRKLVFSNPGLRGGVNGDMTPPPDWTMQGRGRHSVSGSAHPEGWRAYWQAFSVIYFSIFSIFLSLLSYNCFLLFWLCTGDPVPIPLIKHLLLPGQGVLTKGGGGSEMGMSAGALCIYVSVMKLCRYSFSVFGYSCFHSAASMPWFSDEF